LGEEVKKLEGSLSKLKDNESERDKVQKQIEWHKSQQKSLALFLETEMEEEND
jgi:hypothetical protein